MDNIDKWGMTLVSIILIWGLCLTTYLVITGC